MIYKKYNTLINQRDRLKQYLVVALAFAYCLITVLYFALIDVHKLNAKYKKSQADLVTLTASNIEQQLELAEYIDLSIIREDLQKVLP